MLPHSFSLAALLGVGLPEIVTFVIPIAGIILAGVITVSAMYFKNQERQRWHETARIALEKGQPLPVMRREREPERHDPDDDGIHPHHDIRGGLVLIAVGVGLWLFLGQIADQLRFVGAIPGFIGVALLTFALGRALFARKPDRNDRPPQP